MTQTPLATPVLPPEDHWLVSNVQAHRAEILGDLDEAARLFSNSLELARNQETNKLKIAFSAVCLGNIYLQKEQYETALSLFDEALLIRRELLAPCEWEVAEVLHLLAQTYQLTDRYEEASCHWRLFIQCIDWLPDYVPLIRSSVQELLFCRSMLTGLPVPDDYWGISSWRMSA